MYCSHHCLKEVYFSIKSYLKSPVSLTIFSLLLSVFTVLAYHYPFFSAVINNTERDFNGTLITIGLVVLMLSLDFFFYYLLLSVGRFVGKCILAFTFIVDAISFYFVNTYNVWITDKMMGNVFNTRYSEASGFLTWQVVAYVLLLGIVPCIFVFTKKISYPGWKRACANVGLSLVISFAVVGANVKNVLWIDKNSTEIGSLLMPWSCVVNTIRYYAKEHKRNKKVILLPDARITTSGKDVCVLIIGESARRMNFSLYGYGKKTNPYTEKDSVSALIAQSADTYTTAGLKAILDHKPSEEPYEILPNYLNRTGVDVTWRTNNWGEPPVHINKYYKVKDLKEKYPKADSRYDGILLEGLKEEILACESDKMLIVLHTSTSHGPTYNTKYPAEFELFTPVCKTVEVSKSNRQELINAYDNSIVYTDWLIHSVIKILRDIPQRRSCMIYVSDHGESLGEGNLYMHGIPARIAPREQLEIPFIVWTSDKSLSIDDSREVGQYHVFHSVMSFLGVESPVYTPSLDIFATKIK